MKKSLVLLVLLASAVSPALDGGTPFLWKDHPALVKIESNGAQCFGALVGPRAVLLMKYCFTRDRATVLLSNGEERQVRRTFTLEESPTPTLMNVVVGLLSGDPVNDIKPLTIPSRPFKGQSAHLVASGRTPTAEGEFAEGDAQILSVDETEFVTGLGAQCYFGDAGGLALSRQGLLLGLIDRSDMKEKTWFSRLDTSGVEKMLLSFVNTQKTPICGVNIDCD